MSNESMIAQAFTQTGSLMNKTIRSLKRLPYDAEVEYVTMNPGSDVSIGLSSVTSNAFDIKAEVKVSAVPTKDNVFGFGLWTGTSTTSLMVKFDKNKLTYFPSNNSYLTVTNSFGSWSEISFIGKTAKCGSNENTNISRSYAVINPINIHFYCIADSDISTDIRSASVSLFGFMTIRDLIPVKMNDVGYLYDNVSETLFGSTTDVPLIPGPENIF